MDMMVFCAGQAAGDVSGYKVVGQARVDGHAEELQWSTEDIPFDADAPTVNIAIKNAAVAAAVAEQLDVDLDDNINVIAGAT
jgi:hypothetical protein